MKRTKRNRSSSCRTYGFDGETGHAAQLAELLCDEYRQALAPLGVQVVLGGSFKSGLAIPPEPGEPWDVDLRLLYDGDRDDIVPHIEALTGLKLKKSMNVRHGDKVRRLHMIEGQREMDGLLFDIEGSLRDSDYAPVGAQYPRLFSREELAVARKKKQKLRGKKSDYKAYKSSLIEEAQRRMATPNGVYDPGILKAVFLAGGPGSGKTYVTAQLFGLSPELRWQFSSASGLKMRASDLIFEAMLKDHGIDPKHLGSLPPEEFDRLTKGPNSLRKQASKLTQKLMDKWVTGRLGIIWDGTGENFEKIRRRKQELEHLGYDTMMVFVDTSLDIALQRNRARTRSLPDTLVTTMWQTVQDNKSRFQKLFGRKNFVVVNNDVPGRTFDKVMTVSMRFVNAPVRNEIGRAWIARQHRERRRPWTPRRGPDVAQANPRWRKGGSRKARREAYRKRFGPNWWKSAKTRAYYKRGMDPWSV